MHAKTRTAIVTTLAAAMAVLPLGATASAHELPASPAPDDITPEQRAVSAGLPGKIIVVVAGDSLASLARDHGVEEGWRRLFDSNPQVKQPNIIVPGMFLRIPEPQEVFAVRPTPAVTPARSTATSRTSTRASRGSARTTTAPAPATASTSTGVWDRLAACESGGNWAINTGNGYYGGLQFSLSSWRAVGGTGMPHQASRQTQIAMAERLLAIQGWGAWPACSAKLGLR